MQFPYQRVLVLGCGGAGKSTYSAAMGARVCLPVVHLDRLWWLPGWVNRSEEEFDALLCEELQKPAWVMDGNYLRTLPVRLAKADCAVLLDMSAKECLASIRARVEKYRGRSRPDMPEGCPERVDDEFETWIRTYRDETLPQVLRLLRENALPSFIFSSRGQAYTWLEGFENRRGGHHFC